MKKIVELVILSINKLMAKYMINKLQSLLEKTLIMHNDFINAN